MSALRKAFDVKNSSGAIAARLTDSAGAYLSSGNGMVPLEVRFNNMELSTTANQEVVSATEAAAGKRVDLTIATVYTGSAIPPGEYTGIVNMTFDAVAPAAI